MDEKNLTDPDPEQQDPESAPAVDAGDDLSEFEDDPARNPEDENLKKIKGA
ncbi:MAG TPA: hypothetical protein VK304_00290 [Thermoleophilaceae bacterium]|nr:hypothetical protein [Thermoleophilaceae bacterium]